ncbi:DUF3048 domain-containing protein, partial [Amycolatopsis rhizosphaerae]
ALHSPPLADTVVNASPADTRGAYYRDASRSAPHNLFARADALPTTSARTPASLFPSGGAPGGGVPVTERTVAYGAATFSFRWQAGHWLIWQDGSPFTSTEAGQLAAGTVIVQRVATHPEPFPEDTGGGVTPVAETVGSGTATVLRDGTSFAATWSRPAAGSATTFTTGDGQALPVAAGPVWVLLVAS